MLMIISYNDPPVIIYNLNNDNDTLKSLSNIRRHGGPGPSELLRVRWRPLWSNPWTT